MNDKQNQFYSSISKYYSEIFPYQPMQLQFVKNRVGDLKGKNILDIGCATGELAFQLAGEGAKVIGIDLNEDLLSQANNHNDFRIADSKKREPEFASPVFQVGNMLELVTDFQEKQFDNILCFGNTLVHLPSLMLMRQMFEGVFKVLKPGGYFLLQILNYDFILGEPVTELPVIDSENIRFVRKYIIDEKSPLIRFQTQLEIKKEERTVNNETLLFALKSADLVELLEETGFKEIELFSNFKQEPFGGKHLPLVISALKE
ncbi:MAG TPA: class I SAM-dependent methyltransferase [Draconibacterium sp.]|nr:class I SAM-dependent methyltransferase [Draconibacterium sp.]